MGSSIGGVISMCLASMKYTAEALLLKIMSKLNNIVFKNLFSGINDFGCQRWFFMFKKRYSPKEVEAVLKDLCGS